MNKLIEHVRITSMASHKRLIFCNVVNRNHAEIETVIYKMSTRKTPRHISKQDSGEVRFPVLKRTIDADTKTLENKLLLDLNLLLYFEST